MGTRRLTALTLTLIALSSGVASGASIEFDQWRVALQAAQLQWGRTPACGTPTLDHWAGETGGANGWIFWTEPDSRVPRDCVIHVSDHVEETAGSSGGPLSTCPLIVHEYGHLLGLPHSRDPRSIMYDGPRAVDADWAAAWACRRLMAHVQYGTRYSRPEPGVLVIQPIYRWTLRKLHGRIAGRTGAGGA